MLSFFRRFDPRPLEALSGEFWKLIQFHSLIHLYLNLCWLSAKWWLQPLVVKVKSDRMRSWKRFWPPLSIIIVAWSSSLKHVCAFLSSALTFVYLCQSEECADRKHIVNICDISLIFCKIYSVTCPPSSPLSGQTVPIGWFQADAGRCVAVVSSQGEERRLRYRALASVRRKLKARSLS